VSRPELSHRIDVRWPTLFADLTNECRQFFTELRVAIHKIRGEQYKGCIASKIDTNVHEQQNN